MDAHVCIVEVVEIRPGHPPAPDQVVLSTRGVEPEAGAALGTFWSGVWVDKGPVLLVPHFTELTGQVPVVGNVYKVVTTVGKWQ